MSTFTHKATTADGTSIEESVVAEDRYAVYDHARTAGHAIVSVEEVKPSAFAALFTMERIGALVSRVKQDDIVMLSRNLSAMLCAGLALTRALAVSERETKNPALKRVLGRVCEEVQKGKQFHESLTLYPRAFSRLYVAMVRAGEEAGTLADALHTIAVQMEQSSTLRKKIRSAMIYPVIVVTAMVGIGVLMMLYVVQTLTKTFRELKVELPLSTKIILGVSEFLSGHTILALALVAFGIAGVIILYRIQNTFYKTILAGAAVHVEKGKPMSEDFIKNEHLYPVLVGEMVAVGEETGQIAQMLEEVAIFYESEVERKTKDLSTIIEPILMLVIGAAVGFFALAMISPIYSISDSIV